MPIFEYECQSCEHQFQQLIMKEDEIKTLVCPNCGRTRLKRLISRVVYHQSENDRIDGYDPSPGRDSFMKDTRNIGLYAKKCAKQMGFDLGSSFDAKVEKLRTNPGSVFDDAD